MTEGETFTLGMSGVGSGRDYKGDFLEVRPMGNMESLFTFIISFQTTLKVAASFCILTGGINENFL